MQVYPYTIKLIDPLFYSHEALSGAFTQPYLHATTINHAAAWAMGRSREDQSYIICESKGGRNVPRYEHSWIEPDFYFTPASVEGDMAYIVETVKGDMDYLIQPGFGQAKILGKSVGRNEVLKAYRLFSIPPETVFAGYLHCAPDIVTSLPKLVRLGSFRGKALLETGKEEKTFGIVSNQYVNHPVDPLVSRVRRGIMIGMFPYPIVDNALVEDAIEIRAHGQRAFVALPARTVSYDKDAVIKRLEDLNPGFLKAKDISLPMKERAYIVLHMLRTSLSIRHFLMGIIGEERLDAALKEIEGVEEIRLASKGEAGTLDEIRLLGILERIRGIMDDCEGKIKGTTAGKEPKGSGNSSSSIIL